MRKELIFVAHDPGGYSAVFPIYQQFITKYGDEYQILCMLSGAAGALEPNFKSTDENICSYFIKKRDLDNIVLITGTSLPTGVECHVTDIVRDGGGVVVAVLDYWSNYSARFMYNRKTILPDYLFVMDSIARSEAIKDGVPDAIIFEVGHPGLDQFIKKESRYNDAQKRGICFISQPLSLLYGASLGYTEFSVFEDIIRYVNNTDQDVKIKFHPRETREMKELYSRYETKIDLEQVVNSFDIIIGMSSMALLQAYLLGAHKTVSYQPGLTDKDMCICNKLGITSGIYSCGDLYEWLEYNMLSEVRHNECAKGYLWEDGKSTGRCVELIKKITLEGTEHVFS